MLYIQRLLLLAASIGLSYAADKCAHHANNSPNPTGNPISKPGLQDRVPVGKSYDITWQPTTQGKVSIVLLRGPSDLAEEFLCIVDSIDNSGSYPWTPPDTLENDQSHYGLKIIDDATGNYQYSTQFGIKNEKKKDDKKGDKKGDKKDDKSDEKKDGKHTKTDHETKTKTKPCSETEKPCHPSPKPEHKEKEKPKDKPKYVSAKPSKYHNSTIPYPTESKSKTTKSKETHTTKNKDSTSTSLVTSTPSSTDQGQVTSMVVTSAPGEGASPPPTVTTGTPPSTTPEQFPANAAAGLRVTGVFLAGVGAVAWFVL